MSRLQILAARSTARNLTMAALAGVVVLALGYLGIRAIEGSGRERVSNLILAEAEERAALIAADLEARATALQRVVDRWEFAGGTPRAAFEADVGNYIRDFPGYQAIEWVNTTYRVTWIVPFQGNERALGLDLSTEEKRRTALEASKANKRPFMTNPVDLIQGGKGALIFFPIYDNGEFDGFLLAVFRFDNWIDSVFDAAKQVYPSREPVPIHTRLFMAGDEVYQSSEQFPGQPTSERLEFPTGFGPSITVEISVPADFSDYRTEKAVAWSWFANLAAAILIATIVFHWLRARQAAELAVESRKVAEAANVAKSQFLANMSHELRTPLNAVIGFSDLISSGVGSDDPAKTRRYAKNIGASGRILLQLINDILDLAKIEAGRFELSEDVFVVAEEFENLPSAFESKALEKNVHLSFETNDLDFVVLADATRLRQVLYNLIDNAIKFSPGGSVKLTATAAALTGTDEIELSVAISDNGIGISDDQKRAIFQPFSQSDSSISRLFGGTGLGLPISLSIAEKMNGTITVESGSGQGSTFTAMFRLKDISRFQKRSDTSRAEENGQCPLNLGLRVLAVDDVEANLTVTEALLRTMGCEVTVARNGQDAVNRSGEGEFDAILMDIHMPILSGPEAARKIQSDDSLNAGAAMFAWTADVTASPMLSQSGVEWSGTILKPATQDALAMALSRVRKPAA